MNAAEQEAIAIKLQHALAEAGVLIQRADVLRGSVVGWEPVPMPALLGRLMQFGWKITLV